MKYMKARKKKLLLAWKKEVERKKKKKREKMEGLGKRRGKKSLTRPNRPIMVGLGWFGFRLKKC